MYDEEYMYNGPISVSQEQDKVLEVQAWLVYLVAFFV